MDSALTSTKLLFTLSLLSLLSGACSASPEIVDSDTSSFQNADSIPMASGVSPYTSTEREMLQMLEGTFEAIENEVFQGEAGNELAVSIERALTLRQEPGVAAMIQGILQPTDDTARIAFDDHVLATYIKAFLPIVVAMEHQKEAGLVVGSEALHLGRMVTLMKQLEARLPEVRRSSLAQRPTSSESDVLSGNPLSSISSSHYCCEIWVIEDPQPTLCIGYNTVKAWARAKCYATAASIPLTYPVLDDGTCASDSDCTGL